MGNRPKPKNKRKNRGVKGYHSLVTPVQDEFLLGGLSEDVYEAIERGEVGITLASSTRPLMEEIPNQGEDMTDNNPVTVVTDTDPGTPEDTVVTARFNRKKIARIAGTATAVLGGLAVFGAVMKSRGRNEVLDLAGAVSDAETDDTES